MIGAAGSKASLAARTGIDISALGRIRNGQEPRFSHAVQLAEALGIRLEWLATGRGPMHALEAEPAAQLPAALRDLDLDMLLAGLLIAEELVPEAGPEARISAMLRAAEGMRRQHRLPPGFALQGSLLASCFAVVEAHFGRDRPAEARLRTALSAYRALLADAPEPEPPASEPPAAP